MTFEMPNPYPEDDEVKCKPMAVSVAYVRTDYIATHLTQALQDLLMALESNNEAVEFEGVLQAKSSLQHCVARLREVRHAVRP